MAGAVAIVAPGVLAVAHIAWTLFVASSLLLIVTPGQDMVLVMSRSISQGPRAGVATAAGVSTGLVGHTLLASLGLGALLQASELLFLAVKLVGAAYLVYLGISMMLDKGATTLNGDMPRRSAMRLFGDGALSNLSNPKIAIFYFAYLPQFVPANDTHPTLTLLVLGLVFAALTFLVKGPVGLAAGMLSAWLRARPSVDRWMRRVSGLVLVGLGVRLAVERRV